MVIREGEPGALFYVIVEGEAVASVEGRPLRTMGPGDGFGEIALLRDVPRTATVVARGALRTVTLDRTEFLAALSANVDSATAADALARGRLEAGSWSEPDPRRIPATRDLAGPDRRTVPIRDPPPIVGAPCGYRTRPRTARYFQRGPTDVTFRAPRLAAFRASSRRRPVTIARPCPGGRWLSRRRRPAQREPGGNDALDDNDEAGPLRRHRSRWPWRPWSGRWPPQSGAADSVVTSSSVLAPSSGEHGPDRVLLRHLGQPGPRDAHQPGGRDHAASRVGGGVGRSAGVHGVAAVRPSGPVVVACPRDNLTSGASRHPATARPGAHGDRRHQHGGHRGPDGRRGRERP